MAAGHPASVGYPTTVIYARDLSVAGILDGIRSGRVFIDLTGSRDRMLGMRAEAGSASATMGGLLAAPSGEAVSIEVHVAGCSGGSVHFYIDGEDSSALAPQTIASGDETVHGVWNSDGARHWIRAEVVGGDGHILLMGNPVYVNWGSASAALFVEIARSAGSLARGRSFSYSEPHGSPFHSRAGSEAGAIPPLSRAVILTKLVRQVVARYFDEESRFADAVKRGEEALERGEYLTQEQVGLRLRTVPTSHGASSAGQSRQPRI